MAFVELETSGGGTWRSPDATQTTRDAITSVQLAFQAPDGNARHDGRGHHGSEGTYPTLGRRPGQQIGSPLSTGLAPRVVAFSRDGRSIAAALV